MAGKIDGYLKKPKMPYFVVVGAGHLIGNKGIVRLLERKGVVINAQSPNKGAPWWETLLFGFGPTILLVGLLAAFATLLYLGPDVDRPRWEFLTPGSLVAAFLWIVTSGLFAVYTSMFGSYNKTWGSLSAVIVMLTWLWLTGMALLLGAEINSEVERSRRLRGGAPAPSES